MKSVQRHLSGRLTHRLSSNTSNHLTRVDDCALKDFFYRANQLIEGGLVEALFLYNLLGAEVSSEENLKQRG